MAAQFPQGPDEKIQLAAAQALGRQHRRRLPLTTAPCLILNRLIGAFNPNFQARPCLFCTYDGLITNIKRILSWRSAESGVQPPILTFRLGRLNGSAAHIEAFRMSRAH
jgi:hypothetical protein